MRFLLTFIGLWQYSCRQKNSNLVYPKVSESFPRKRPRFSQASSGYKVTAE